MSTTRAAPPGKGTAKQVPLGTPILVPAGEAAGTQCHTPVPSKGEKQRCQGMLSLCGIRLSPSPTAFLLIAFLLTHPSHISNLRQISGHFWPS